jgi:hypothetical protein
MFDFAGGEPGALVAAGRESRTLAQTNLLSAHLAGGVTE